MEGEGDSAPEVTPVGFGTESSLRKQEPENRTPDMAHDPFADPTPRTSDFASADSFRGRLILIEPVKVERDVPKTAGNPNGPKGDRVTATVTVVDGQGPVQTFHKFQATGKWLSGDVHHGVWFGQDQLAAGLQTEDGKSLLPMVLCRIDTLKPGTQAGQGNPWVMNAVGEEEKQIARNYLANRMVNGASAPTVAAQPAPAPAPQPYGYPQQAGAPAPAPQPAYGYPQPAPAPQPQPAYGAPQPAANPFG
jgi:hypothetical protein